MDECEEINFVVGWLQENGFELKRVSEGKKNFVIPKLRNVVASNSYMGGGGGGGGGVVELQFFTICGVFEWELQIYVGNLT
jgi:hypothetical protein